jgi:hypothetical protein
MDEQPQDSSTKNIGALMSRRVFINQLLRLAAVRRTAVLQTGAKHQIFNSGREICGKPAKGSRSSICTLKKVSAEVIRRHEFAPPVKIDAAYLV